MTFCWHRYTRWSKILISADKVPFQYKTCERCGKSKVREAW